MDSKRGAKASEKQKQMLLEVIKLRPELLSGIFSNAFTHQTAMDQRKEIAKSKNFFFFRYPSC
jgi:hypothetical protein